MSSVDNRVVQMEFNNKRFENNVKTTMSTLDKLKAALSFKKQEQELEELQNASDSFSLGHMESVLDKIGDKFSLFGMVGMNAMQRIANAAVDAGEKVLKSLTIDQVRAGWSKYEEETNAVQTIYSAVKQKGKSIDDVYDVLEDLAAYTDETSYSYSEMVGSMSNFISKGIDMGVAEKAMEGIANAAASAGIGIHDAGMAFRNFADAISSGYMQLRDWRSLKLVHMDTEAFVNDIIEAAKEIGTIDKKTGKLAVTAGKAAKNEIVNIQNFDELLRYGFVNTEVMLKVLQKYADREDEVGKAAFAAAQNAKTFTDVLDSVKDAASTGWKTTFRIIFGELNEAIDFFTPMANRLISIVNSVDEARNNLLTGWKTLGGRDDLVSALDRWWSSIEAVWELIGNSVKEAYHVKTLLGGVNQAATYIGEAPEDMLDPGILMKWTEAFKKTADAVNSWLNEETGVEEEIIGHSDSLYSIFKGLFSATNIAYQMFSGVATFISEVKAQLLPAFNRLVFYFGKIGDYISDLNDKILQAKTFEKFANRLSKIFIPIAKRLPTYITGIVNGFNRLKEAVRLNPNIQRNLASLKDMFDKFFTFLPTFVEGTLAFAEEAFAFVKKSDEWKWVTTNFDKYIRPIATKFVKAGTLISSAFSKFFSTNTKGIDNWYKKLKKRLEGFKELGPIVASYWEALKTKYPILKEVEDWLNESPVVQFIKKWVTAIGSAFDSFFRLQIIDNDIKDSIFGRIKQRLLAAWAVLKPVFEETYEEISGYLNGKWTALKEKYPIFQTIEDFVTSIFGKKDEAKKVEGTVEESSGFVKALKDALARISGIISGASLGDIAKFALGMVLVVKAFKTVKSLADWTSLGETVKDAFENVTGAIEQAYKYIKAKKTQARADTMKAIAMSIYVLANTLKTIGSMPFEDIAVGLVGLGLLFAETGGFMAYLNFLNKHSGRLGGAVTQGTQLVSIAVSAWILGRVLKSVSQIEWDAMERGLAGMGGLFAETGVFYVLVNNLTKTGSITQKNGLTTMIGKKQGLSGTGLIAVAISMRLLGEELKSLSELEWDAMLAGLGGMGLLFAETGVFYVLVNNLTKIGNVSEKRGLAGLLGKKQGLSGTGLIAVAISMRLLGEELKSLSELEWDKILRGLTGMAGLFVETGVFYVVVNNLTKIGRSFEKAGTKAVIGEKKGLSATGLIAVAISIRLLGEEMRKIGEMDTDKMKQGLLGLAGLFAEDGAFMLALHFLNKGKGLNEAAMNASIGVLSGSVAALGSAMEKLGKLDYKQLLRGGAAISAIGVILVAFTWMTTKIKKPPKVSNLLGFAVAAGALYIMASAFAKLSNAIGGGQKGLERVGTTTLALLSIISSMFLMTKAMEGAHLKLSSTFSMFATAIALAGLMVAFALAISLAKDVEPGTIMAFSAGMVLISGAMLALSTVLKILQTIPVSGAVKAAANLVIIAGAIGLAIAVIEGLVSAAIEDFSDTITHVGSNLSLYSGLVERVNYDVVKNSVDLIYALSKCLVEVGLHKYGNVEDFSHALVRIGSAFSIFDGLIQGHKFNRASRVTEQLAGMSADLKTIGEIPDVSEMIANIGAALKLFSDNTGGIKIDIGKIPDTESLKQLFANLAGSVPEESTFAGISAYGTDEAKTSLTTFALGLVNLATAIDDYQEKIKDLDTTHMDKVTESITAIARLNNDLEGKTEITANIGAFAVSIKTDKPDLTTFSMDITALGEAVKEFYTAIHDIDTEKLDAAIIVIGKIVDLNNALPPTGGISQWITGEKSLGNFAANLNTLGEGTKQFANAIKGAMFDGNSAEKAAGVLLTLAKVNQKLPKTGGFISWFAGEQSLSTFAEDLGTLGTGMKAFITNFDNTTVGSNIQSALSPLNQLANIQKTLSEGWGGNLAIFADDLVVLAEKMVTFNNKLNEVTKWADIKPLENILTLGVGKYNELGANKYEKRLAKLGSDLDDFFYYVEAINKDTYGEAAGIITDIFNALTDISAESFPEAGTAIVAEIATGVTNNAAALIGPGGVIRIVISGAASVAESYETDFYNAGIFFCEGLANGMIDGSGVVMNAAMNVVAEALDAARAEAGQASPWKTTIEMGKFFDYGLANGINNYGEVIERSAKGIVNSALDPIMEELKMVASLPLDELDLSPTIRPVLDADDFIHDVGSLNGLLTRESVYLSSDDTRKLQSIAADLAYANNGNGLSDILKSVNDVGSRLEQMEESIRNMKLILDTGALVGGISDGVDEKIGMKSIMAERGN